MYLLNFLRINLYSRVVILLAAILFLVASFAAAETAPNTEELNDMIISFLPESQIKIAGDSTLKKFSATASAVELKGKALKKPESTEVLPWTPTEVEMVLVVKNLQSGDETLDEHMHESLKAEKHAQIQMKLSTFSFSNSNGGKVNSVAASGTLTVAGVSRPIELSASLLIERQNLRIKGKKSILMSDFGIKPPTMMFGALTTRDEIEISFDVVCLINTNQKE